MIHFFHCMVQQIIEVDSFELFHFRSNEGLYMYRTRIQIANPEFGHSRYRESWDQLTMQQYQ
jgi:hypothetical protein